MGGKNEFNNNHIIIPAVRGSHVRIRKDTAGSDIHDRLLWIGRDWGFRC